MKMFPCNFAVGTAEGGFSGQPLINHYTKSVLIACSADAALEALWRHIGCRPDDFIQTLENCLIERDCDAKIAQHDLIPRADEHILRLDILVDVPPVVNVL